MEHNISLNMYTLPLVFKFVGFTSLSAFKKYNVIIEYNKNVYDHIFLYIYFV